MSWRLRCSLRVCSLPAWLQGVALCRRRCACRWAREGRLKEQFADDDCHIDLEAVGIVEALEFPSPAHTGVSQSPFSFAARSQHSPHEKFVDVDELAREDDDFHSCNEMSLDADICISCASPPTSPKAQRIQKRQKMPPQNTIRVSQYRWIEEVLHVIILGRTRSVSEKIKENSDTAIPLFVVAGACPNSFCGMQAVLFNAVGGGAVDFWWIKPSQRDGTRLELQTLYLHRNGKFKNVPGRSKAVYDPLAQMFNEAPKGTYNFGVDSSGRAFIEELQGSSSMRLLLYLVWQESWSSPLSRKKYIRGKICYQKGSSAAPGPVDESAQRYFARQYEIRDGQIWIAPVGEEELIPSLLPPDCFQEMYDMSHFI